MRQSIVESRAARLGPAVGRLSMKTGETRGYVLTFRCINCEKYSPITPPNTSRLKTESVSAYIK